MVRHHDQQQLELFSYLPAVPRTRLREQLEALDALIDWSFIGELAAPHFAAGGRPSVDPVVIVKMMLVKRLFGIESDRALVDFCSDSLAVRAFLGYRLSESLPCFDTLSEWRRRLGPEFFDQVLQRIVLQCVDHGMRMSEERVGDATEVKALASRFGPTVEVPRDLPPEETAAWIAAAEAQPEAALQPGTPTRLANRHDPEARLSTKYTGRPGVFSYQVSWLCDPESGLITSTSATAQELAENLAELLRDDPGRPRRVAADGLYDDAAALAAVQELGVECYVPERRTNHRRQIQREAFRYDAVNDCYICPNGCLLRHSSYHAAEQEHRYTARKSDCSACPCKRWCTDAPRRQVTRKEHEPARERTVRDGPGYRLRQRWRRIAEHLNRLAKRDHGMTRADALGLAAMRIQAAMTAVAINLNKLLRFVAKPRPAAVLALATTTPTATPRGHALGILQRPRHRLGWQRNHTARPPAPRPADQTAPTTNQTATAVRPRKGIFRRNPQCADPVRRHDDGRTVHRQADHPIRGRIAMHPYICRRAVTVAAHRNAPTRCAATTTAEPCTVRLTTLSAGALPCTPTSVGVL